MFPTDPHSMRQMHAADMHVAHQRRNQGKVVTPTQDRWHHALFAKLSRALLPARPDTTPIARSQRRQAQATAGFTLLDATTGGRLED